MFAEMIPSNFSAFTKEFPWICIPSILNPENYLLVINKESVKKLLEVIEMFWNSIDWEEVLDLDLIL